MIGFEYICKCNGVSYSNVAELLGITKQTVSIWLSGNRGIGKKHLPKLSEYFNVPVEYFQKDINEVDKVIIDLLKATNAIESLSPANREYLIEMMEDELHYLNLLSDAG